MLVERAWGIYARDLVFEFIIGLQTSSVSFLQRFDLVMKQEVGETERHAKNYEAKEAYDKGRHV